MTEILIFLALLQKSPEPRATTKTAHLTWTASVTSGVTYNVYKSYGNCASNSAFSRITTSPVAALFYDDLNVPVGVYCYYVTSFLSTAIPNESGPSNKADLSVSDPQPQPPLNLQVVPQSATLILGEQQQFRASRESVEWSLDPPLGTIDFKGLYTAPDSIKGNNVKVMVLAKDLAGSDTATVTLKRR